MPRRFANSNGRARVSKDEDERLGLPSCFETHRSACARVRAAMLLSMRGDGAQHILAERSHLAGDTNLRLWKSGAGWIHCFGVVLYNESCNPNSVEPSTPRYCLGMPARSITAAHLPMSPARRAFNSSGVLALASIPSSA